MIQDLIKTRYSARTFTDRVIEKEKIEYILDCAYNAPSKQSLYPWSLYVLDESPKCKEFKEWLFWEDTWCYKGLRADPEGKNSNDKRFNGQYRAPLLLLWAHRDLNPEQHKDQNYWKYYWPFAQQQNLIDMAVSSSFALLAAEEVGLKTCFGRCHSYEYENSILGEGSVKIGVALGIGYAEEDSYNGTMLRPVEKNSFLEGYDTKNLSQIPPIKNHNIRSNKPSKSDIVKYIE